MKVLVDSCIWSLALRRNQSLETATAHELKELIMEVRVQIIGAVRQEVLSGIKLVKQFEAVKHSLSAFDDLTLSENDYELAAEFFNLCRSKGVQGSNTDFLICAASANYKIPIFTHDHNFVHFKKHIPIQLHTIRKLS